MDILSDGEQWGRRSAKGTAGTPPGGHWARAHPTCQAIVKGLDDGDHMVYDLFPTPSLSGEHGIGYDAVDLAAGLGLDPDSDAMTDATEAYFTAAGEAFWAEAERIARERVTPAARTPGKEQPVNHQPADPGYQRGDRIALEHTTDPHTRLRPGDEGTVTRYDPKAGQFSDCSAPFDASELRFYFEDMSVTLSSRRGGRMI
jgi:hypothetical protein